MSHQISIQNGRAEVFSGQGLVPWHKLGTIVAGRLTAAEAIESAHLGWLVQPLPVSVNGRQLAFPDDKTSEGWQGICRADTGDCLGITKGRYEIIQNADCFAFMDSLVNEGQLKYETAGALRGGRQVWMMARYDGDIEINQDKHEQWLLCVSSHDGSYSLMVQWVTVRVVCANTLSVALSGAKNQVKIRHTANWENKEDEARRVLGLTKDYFAAMRESLSGLADKAMTADDMNAFTKLLFPSKHEKDVPTRTSNMRWGVERLFSRGAGNRGASRWDALNAVTDFADHEAKLRGENSTRLESALLGSGAQLKQRAFETLTSADLMTQLLNVRGHTPSAAPTNGGSDFSRLLGQ